MLQLGIIPYAGVDIAVFEMLKERLLDEYEGFPPAHMILGAGMVSSSIAQFASYPLALTRTRLQVGALWGGLSLWKPAIRQRVPDGAPCPEGRGLPYRAVGLGGACKCMHTAVWVQRAI